MTFLFTTMIYSFILLTGYIRSTVFDYRCLNLIKGFPELEALKSSEKKVLVEEAFCNKDEFI